MAYEHIITNAQTGEITVIPFTQAEIDEKLSRPKIVPTEVTMRQARLALLQSGVLETVNQSIANGREADKITWEYATEVNRSDSLVQNLAIRLNLTETDLDNLFLLASSL